MTQAEFWSWVFVIGTAGLGWSPNVVMAADMSDILLAWEGKQLLMNPFPSGDGTSSAGLSPADFARIFGG